MSILVIGGDRIDSIRRELSEHGLDDIEHWVGRKPADARRAIPARVRLVVIVTDQLNHNLLYNATLRATRLGLPIIYSRRSASDLRGKLEERLRKLRPQEQEAAIGISGSAPSQSGAYTGMT